LITLLAQFPFPWEREVLVVWFSRRVFILLITFHTFHDYRQCHANEAISVVMECLEYDLADIIDAARVLYFDSWHRYSKIGSGPYDEVCWSSTRIEYPRELGKCCETHRMHGCHGSSSFCRIAILCFRAERPEILFDLSKGLMRLLRVYR
jgi:hypothetical protein